MPCGAIWKPCLHRTRRDMLYLVGTPIGNMGDITARAVEVLRSVDIIACEDTRHTGLLLQKLNIRKPLFSYYKHKEQEGTLQICEWLQQGKNVALVSDAGMPVISDPGSVLVQEARRRGLSVCVVPGPTAVTSALCLAGVTGGFVFLGFLADKAKARDKQLTPYINSPLPLVLYCATHDLTATFDYLRAMLGNRRVLVVKELTKMFESVYDVTLQQPIDFDTHGEFVLIVEGQPEQDYSYLTPLEHIRRYMAMGCTKKEAVKRVAAERGVPKDEIYKAALAIDEEP